MAGIPDMKKLPGFGIERDRDQALEKTEKLRVTSEKCNKKCNVLCVTLDLTLGWAGFDKKQKKN